MALLVMTKTQSAEPNFVLPWRVLEVTPWLQPFELGPQVSGVRR